MIEKLKKVLSKATLMQILMTSVVINAIVSGTSIADALILIPLAGILAFDKWLGDLEAKNVNDWVIQELQEMKARIVGQTAFGPKKKDKDPIQKFWG